MSKIANTTKTTKTKQPKKTPAPAVWVPPTETRALMLRTCDEGMKAHGGFIWPRSGYVEAPDWSPEKKCGNGLHGLLWGAGKANLLNAIAVDWLVVEIDSAEAIDLGGKIKVPRCNVVFVGSRVDAVTMIQAQAPAGTPIVYGTATAGCAGTATAGARGTATAGLYGVLAIEWFDGKNYRRAIAEVDGSAIKANTTYKVVDGKFVEVRP